jgi:hypothetical protein
MLNATVEAVVAVMADVAVTYPASKVTAPPCACGRSKKSGVPDAVLKPKKDIMPEESAL